MSKQGAEMANRASLSDAPAILNTNDRAMWVLGFNAAIESIRPFTEDQIDQLYLSKVAGHGPFDGIRSAFHAMVRTIEQAHGIGTNGVNGEQP